MGSLYAGLAVLDYKGGEGAHRRVRVRYGVGQLHVRVPLLGGHLTADVAAVALVEEAEVGVCVAVPLVRFLVPLAEARGDRGADELGADTPAGPWL